MFGIHKRIFPKRQVGWGTRPSIEYRKGSQRRCLGIYRIVNYQLLRMNVMKKVAVIGLGYVGLPLAVAFGEKRPVVGFDINSKRIAELKDGEDFTREVSPEELAA